MDAHNHRPHRKTRRLEGLFNDLAAALAELPAERIALFIEDLRMGMIDTDLRAVIVGSKLTPYAIAKKAGVTPDQITRFILGERDLRLASAAKVAHALGLELRRPRKVKPAAAR